MIFETILPIITVVLLGIASLIDIKTREVPDIISYGLLFVALGLRIVFAPSLGWSIILWGVIGLIAGYILAAALYYTHQWGGADSKLLMAMGAVIGISFPLSVKTLDFALFLIALLFVGATYGILWMIGIAIKNKKTFSQKFKSALKEHGRMHVGVAIASILLLIVLKSTPHFWFIALFPPMLLYLFVFVTTIESSYFSKWIPVTKLTLGDWLDQDIHVGGKPILEKTTIDDEEFKLLHNLYKQKKIKEIKIKEGIPFVPSFFLAYLILIYGRKLFDIIFSLFLA